jgi:hypothetical protein
MWGILNPVECGTRRLGDYLGITRVPRSLSMQQTEAGRSISSLVFILIALAGCGGGGGGSLQQQVSVSPSTAAVQVGANQQFTAVVGNTANVAFSWQVNAIPGGNSAVGTISSSGLYLAPPTSVPSPATVAVTAVLQSDTSKTGSATVTIVPSLTITTFSLPSAFVGYAYSATLDSNGGTPPFAWNVNAGNLPPGLALDSAGVISGTPTAMGDSSFTVQVSDSGTPRHAFAAPVDITVNGFSIGTAGIPIPVGTVGTAYSITLVAGPETSQNSWQIVLGSLPAGLNLNSGTGLISGVPTSAGFTTFTVQATDSANPHTAQATFTLAISLSPAKNILHDSPEESSAPQLAVDSSGNINVVWSQIPISGGPQVFFSRSTDGGTIFSTPKQIGHPASDPLIAVDAIDNINVIWANSGLNNNATEFTRSTDGGATFSSAKQMSGASHISLDAAGNIYLWGSDNSIQISKDDGATFYTSQIFTTTGGVHSVVAVDSTGNINVVWSEDGKSLLFSRSTDGGISFSAPLMLHQAACSLAGAGPVGSAVIQVDSLGHINIVWNEGCYSSSKPFRLLSASIYFSSSVDNGTSFSIPKQLSDDNTLAESPRTAVDSKGNIFVVWAPMSMTRSTDGGATFSTPITLSSLPGDQQQIAVNSDGIVYVAWSADTLSGNHEIFFTRSTDAGATFSNPIENSVNYTNSTSPQIAIDTMGQLNVIWLDHTIGNWDIVFMRP